jgi:Holliday junction DNA helicase RuvA
MIGYLRGTARQAGSAWVIDVNGTGWKVNTPHPLVDGNDTELFITTHVREEAITLYGFATADDQSVFEALTRVSGVGPASALAVLRDLGADGTRTAIAAGDTKTISKVKGIGATGAGRIVSMAKLPDAPVHAALDTERRDALEALEALGYERGAAWKALAALPDGDATTLIRSALETL